MILDFNTPSDWSLNAQASIVADPTAPLQPNVLRMVFGGFDPAASRPLTGLQVGRQYPVLVRCNFDDVEEGSPLFVRIQYADNPAYFNANLFKLPDVTGWELRDCGMLTYGEPGVIDGLVRLVGIQNFNPGRVLINALLIGEEEAQLVRSNALPFADKLKALIEAIDPNIGRVYVTTKRWPTIERLEDEGTLRITGASVLDDDGRIGKDVTRFWWMKIRIDCQPLTNGSAEYVTSVELTGFYQHEDGDAQFAALNRAAIEILDAVNTKEAELETLSTGDAYLGYLLNRPRMGLIESAQLESPKVVGNAVQITISFAEEVSYT